MCCKICFGPTCDKFYIGRPDESSHSNSDSKSDGRSSDLDDDLDDDGRRRRLLNILRYTTFDKLDGVGRDDAKWLTSSVVIYADFVSPPGMYDTASRCVISENIHSKNNDDIPSLVGSSDFPMRDENDVSGAGTYDCSNNWDCVLAHEGCIRLAASWSKFENPRRYPAEGPPPLNQFFRTNNGHPVIAWLCDCLVANPDDRTEHARETSITNKAGLAPEIHSRVRFCWSIALSMHKRRRDMRNLVWREGYGLDYVHESWFSVTHLKRPDVFPTIHSLSPDTHHCAKSAFYPRRCPTEITLMILANLEQDDLHSLSQVSHPFRSFITSPLAQKHLWMEFVHRFYLPTESDRTESAHEVNNNLGVVGSARLFDWRRYCLDCKTSPNMTNRMRIRKAVAGIDKTLSEIY